LRSLRKIDRTLAVGIIRAGKVTGQARPSEHKSREASGTARARFHCSISISAGSAINTANTLYFKGPDSCGSVRAFLRLALVVRYHLMHMLWNMLQGGIFCTDSFLCSTQLSPLRGRADWHRVCRCSPQMHPVAFARTHAVRLPRTKCRIREITANKRRR
jgi:hypothetical protein